MIVYRVTRVYIDPKHDLFSWCHKITALANNLSNACRFRQRQLLTASRKDFKNLTENEKEVLAEFRSYLGDGENVPSFPGYNIMEKVMRYHHNPDYFAEGLPRQSAQQVLMKATDDMVNYFSALRKAKEDAVSAPNLPGYKRKGGHTSVRITNQDCTLKPDRKGSLAAGLPFAKKLPLKIGRPLGRLKQAEVCPDNGRYVICFTFEVELPDVQFSSSHSRIASIDFGVDNLMAVTNNCGLPCLLYKGGVIKSINQNYNKRLSAIMQEEMVKPGCPKNRNGAPRFVPTAESQEITLCRNNSITDVMHKASKHFITWCVENRIDTIVAGVNPGFKQDPNLGRVNNQNFVQIPLAYLRQCIEYLAEEHGIHYIEREESYTSKASFPDWDYIPTYGVDDENAAYSGKRRPAHYRGMYKKDGFRGLYQTADGTIVNADLNASANILRKQFPEAFEGMAPPDFENVTVIRHPDERRVIANREKQRASCVGLSKSKQRRMRRKAA